MDKIEAGDTKPKGTNKSDYKGTTESTKQGGNDDKTKNSGETSKAVRQRCKSNTKMSSTPKKSEDQKSKPGTGVDRANKRANNDDDPMLRDEKDLDVPDQESGK